MAEQVNGNAVNEGKKPIASIYETRDEALFKAPFEERMMEGAVGDLTYVPPPLANGSKMTQNSRRTKIFPLPPQPLASKDCLLERLELIYTLLLARRFSDAVSSKAVDVVLHVGLAALASGKAAGMADKQRAAWLWQVAMNAARRAARMEPIFVSMKYEPADVNSIFLDEERDEMWLAICEQLALLPDRQKQAVDLLGLQGLSQRKAAAQMGVRPATVVRHYRVAIANLNSALNAMMEYSH